MRIIHDNIIYSIVRASRGHNAWNCIVKDGDNFKYIRFFGDNAVDVAMKVHLKMGLGLDLARFEGVMDKVLEIEFNWLRSLHATGEISSESYLELTDYIYNIITKIHYFKDGCTLPDIVRGIYKYRRYVQDGSSLRC